MDRTLTDMQYMGILYKIKKVVMDPKFKLYCYDSDEWGNKFNESNCGFCNDNFASEEDGTAGREAVRTKYYLKDRRKNQPCPFDLRPQTVPVYEGWREKRKFIKEEKTDYSCSCFYNCFLFGQGKIFKKLNKKSTNIEYIRFLVSKTIREAAE